MKLEFPEGGIAAAVASTVSAADKLASKLPPEDRGWLACCTKRYVTELKRLRRRVHSEDRKAEYAQTDVLLTSFVGRLAGVIRVVDGPTKQVLPENVTRQVLEDLANGFALDEQLPGKAKMVLVSQGGKPPRVTLEFEWQARAAQLLIADVLRAKGVANKYEFNQQGRGRDKAAIQIRDAILEGYRSWLSFDLKNFYSSVGPKHLKWLGLPPKVMRHSVLCNAELPIYGPVTEDRLKAARHGLPTGAMLSGKIASGLIGRMLRDIPGDYRVWSYVDDVRIGARSPAATVTIADAVKKVVENNSAGPLAFKYFEIAEAIEGFSFLNYRFRLEGRDGEPHVHIHPDNSAFNNLRDKLDRKLTKLKSKSFDNKTALALAYAERWRAAYPLWDANDYALNNLNAIVEEIAADHGTICAKKHVPLLGYEACIGSKNSAD